MNPSPNIVDWNGTFTSSHVKRPYWNFLLDQRGKFNLVSYICIVCFKLTYLYLKKTSCNFPEFCQILLSSSWEKKMTRTGWSELNHILILVFTNHTLPLWKYEYLPSCWCSVVVVSSTVLALTASMMIFCDWTFRNGSEAQKVHLLPCLFFISIYIHFPYTN